MPKNVKHTIQNISEITGGGHSDEEIYAIPKECCMNPDEALQRLLSQDAFREVRRERGKKNEASSSPAAAQSDSGPTPSPTKSRPPSSRAQPPSQNTEIVRHQPTSTDVVVVAAIPEQQHPPQQEMVVASGGGGTSGGFDSPSSRWPKQEVLALIKLRSGLESRYQEAGPKGPLWEEISAGMQRMGYNRSSKRCKEKWENIDKYFKKVKESNKKPPEDAKTYTYFHQLDALYRKKMIGGSGSSSFGHQSKQEDPMAIDRSPAPSSYQAIMPPQPSQTTEAENKNNNVAGSVEQQEQQRSSKEGQGQEQGMFEEGNGGKGKHLVGVEAKSNTKKGSSMQVTVTKKPVVEDLWNPVLPLYYLFPPDYEFYKNDAHQLWCLFSAGPLIELPHDYFFQFSRIDNSTGMPMYILKSMPKDRYDDDYLIIDDVGSCIPKTTMHISVRGSIDSSFFDNLYEIEVLKTLFILRGDGPCIDRLPSDLFRKLPYLQALDLSHTGVTELPSSIRFSQQLRYLNLSYTSIVELPNSVCNILTLETLNLRGCLKLRSLPKAIRRLSSLKHLDVDVSCLLVSMPPGVGDLSQLQTLPAFVVGKQYGWHINELKNLKYLCQNLRVLRLENLSSPEQAKEASLHTKSHLQKLEFHWSRPVDGFEVLESLHPGPFIQELQIVGYGGAKFPSWIGEPSFFHLTTITIHNCSKSNALPSLGKLHSLKFLHISHMDEVKAIDQQFNGDSMVDHENMDEAFAMLEQHEDMVEAFAMLEQLTFIGMPALNQWVGVREGDFPRLQKLKISQCPKLKILPKLSLFRSLQQLEISLCHSLESFPDGEFPISLQSIVIVECPKLKERCHKDIGENWEKLAHITDIWIDYQKISLRRDNTMSTIRIPEVVPSPNQDCERLKKAFDGWETDEKAIIWVLGHRNATQRSKIKETYQQLYNESLLSRLQSKLFGDFGKAVILWTMDPHERDAKLANEYLKKKNGISSLQVIVEIACTTSPYHLMAVRQSYCSLFGCSLEEDVVSHVSLPIRKLLVGLVSSFRYDGEAVDGSIAGIEITKLREAIERKQLDHDDVIHILSMRNIHQLQATFQLYKEQYGNSIDQDIKNCGNGDFESILQVVIRCIDRPEKHFAKVVRDSIVGLGTDEDSLTRAIITRAEVDLMKIRAEYYNAYSTSLDNAVSDDTSGDYKKFLLTLLGAKP